MMGSIDRAFSKYGAVDYDYEYAQGSNHPEYCDYMCRCSIIIDLKVTGVYLNYIYENIVAELKKEYQEISTQHLYCIDRLLSIHKVYDPDLWDLDVVGGYYGQEVGQAHFNGQVRLVSDIYKVMSLSTDDAIKYVLVAEYGYLLKSLEDKTFTVYSLNLDEISIPNDRYLKTVEGDSLALSGINGLLMMDHGRFKMIDGHHRYTSLMREADKNKLLDYIVAEEKE